MAYSIEQLVLDWINLSKEANATSKRNGGGVVGTTTSNSGKYVPAASPGKTPLLK